LTEREVAVLRLLATGLLRGMEACGLVSFQRLGKEKVVRLCGAAFAKALRALRRPKSRSVRDRVVGSARVRAALAHDGAPLFVPSRQVRRSSCVLTTLE